MELYEKLEMLGNAFSMGEVDALSEILNKNCSYNSDYAHKRMTSAEDILDGLRRVYSAVQKSVENGENCTYNYKVIQLNSVFKEGIKIEDLNGKTFFDVYEKGLLLYQYGDKDPVAVVFIKTNPGGQITEINLSRNHKWFDIRFYGEDGLEDSEKDIPYTVKPMSSHDRQVKELQAAWTHQNHDYEELDDSEVYIWRKADEYIKRWLADHGYYIIESQIFDDCIGYRCNRNNYAYTIYMYAYGQNKTTQLDGDYCASLLDNKLSRMSTVLVVYLNVKRFKDGNKVNYSVCNYSGDEDHSIELWRVSEVEGKKILEYYPRKEMMDATYRLMYAFNRDDMDAYYTEEFFLEKNVRFIAINDNVDTMKEDNDIAPFKNILNEMYAKDISRKVRSARKVNARQGKFMGSQVPYGYKRSPLDKHQLVIDPEVAPIVKMIYEMSEKGYSKREIAVKLNSLCVLSPAAYYYVREGKPSPKPLEEMLWNANTLYTLIANPVYRGDMVQGRRKVQSYKTKRREIVPEDNWIIVENTHEAIVDRSTWKKVQSNKQTNRDPKTTANSDINIFRGIIRCADCGSAMCFNTKYHYGEKTYFYRCSRYISKGKEACASHCIAEDLLKRAVLFDIQNHIKMIESEKDDLIEKLSALKYEFEQDSKTDVTAKINKTKKRIAEINHMVKQLFEEKVTGSIPETMYKTMVAQYCDEKDDLCAELDNLEKALDNKENEEVDILRWVDNMLAFVNIKELDRDTVLTLIDHIEVHETERINGKKQFRISVFYKFVGNIHSQALDVA